MKQAQDFIEKFQNLSPLNQFQILAIEKALLFAQATETEEKEASSNNTTLSETHP